MADADSPRARSDVMSDDDKTISVPVNLFITFNRQLCMYLEKCLILNSFPIPNPFEPFMPLSIKKAEEFLITHM